MDGASFPAEEVEPPKLSVVVPLFNEEDNIDPLHLSISTVMHRLEESYEIIYVDDGSSDDTVPRLQKVLDREPFCRIVKLRRNFGQTAAMAAGFEAARGQIIVTLDGDLQNDPEDIPMMLEKMKEGYSLVCGWRKNRKDKLVSRKIPSKIANHLIGAITGVRIHDYGCTLKAMRASVMKGMHLYSDMHRFLPAISRLSGGRVAEVVVRHHPRRFGVSKYGITRTAKVILDLMVIKMIVSFMSRPAHWFGVLSLPFFVLSFGVLAFGVIASGGQGPEEVAGNTVIYSSISFLLFFVFIHFLAAGLLAELILRTGDYHPNELLKGHG